MEQVHGLRRRRARGNGEHRPNQYPDENPLAVKEGGSSPTPDEVKQYTDGVVSPFEIAYDNSYTYRGLDENVIGDERNPYPTHLGTSPRYHGK